MWQLERKISIPTIIMMAGYLFGGMVFAGAFFTKVENLGNKVKEVSHVAGTNLERTIRLEERQKHMSSSLDRIEDYLRPTFSRHYNDKKDVTWKQN